MSRPRAGEAAATAVSIDPNRRHDRRGWGATPKPSEESSYDAEFSSMAAFAESVDEQFG